MRILDFTNHDDTVQASDAFDISQRVEHEVLIGFHIPGIYLEPLDPKSSASTNFATSAFVTAKIQLIFQLKEEKYKKL